MSDSEIAHQPSAVRHGVPHEAIHARFAVAMLRARLHEQNRASRHQSCGGASVCMASHGDLWVKMFGSGFHGKSPVVAPYPRSESPSGDFTPDCRVF
jgi:hypothetical protein